MKIDQHCDPLIRVGDDFSADQILRNWADSSSCLPANLRPWQELAPTFKKVNREQAKYVVDILASAGYNVRQVEGDPVVFTDFARDEIEQMAELEHGRWNMERLRDGWRYGPVRDDRRNIHDCLVPWSKLPPEQRKFDYLAVRELPEILAAAKLEVFRR